MGLDLVELVMRAEEEFEIEIGDEEASLCATAGQLCQLIALKMGVAPGFDAAPPRGCRSSAMFYQMRRDLMAASGVARREIGPKTPLSALLSPSQRRRMWRQFQGRRAPNLPNLQVPKPLWSAMIVSFFAATALGSMHIAAGEIWWIISCVSGWLCLMAFASDSPFARAFPATCTTAGDLSRYALPDSAIEPSAGQSALWVQVQHLIADELSVPLEEVTPEAHFVYDLGAG